MIEKTVLDYLNNVLGIPVYMELTPPIPKRYAVIEKTGSRRSNRIESATLAIQSVGETLYEAASINQFVKQAMFALPDQAAGVFSVELDSDYNYTNTNTKERRYQAVFDITFKE